MRTDAVQVILEVNARMRALDSRLRITYESGWERSGNGLGARYVGGIVHDTTSPSSAAKPFPTQTMLRVGRPDLSGPIANYGGPYCTLSDPWIHVVAAFPANHAGASGGRSMGPLPVSSLFNPTVLGLEIDFSGLELMSAGQMYVGQLWARAVADVLAGGNLEYVRAHFETSITGKIDISYGMNKSYDMAAFRRSAATLTPGQEDDMPAFTDRFTIPKGFPGEGAQLALWEGVYSSFYANRKLDVLAAQISAQTETIRTLAAARDDDLDVEALLQRVDATVRGAMADTVDVQVSVVDGDR